MSYNLVQADGSLKNIAGGGGGAIVEGKPIYGERKQYDTNKKMPLAGQAALKYTMDRDGILTGSCHKKGQGYSAWLHMNGKALTTFDNYGGEGCSFDFPNVRVKAGDVIELTTNVPTTETTNFFWLNNIGVTPIVGMEPGSELKVDIINDTIISTTTTWSSEKISDELSKGGGGSSKLSENITSNVTVGGIETNTTYAKGTDIEEIIKNLLVKYLPPAITTSISPSTSPLYVGDTVAKVTISAAVTKQSKPITSVKFYAAGVMVHETTTGVADGGTFTFDYEPATAISATTSFYATVSDGTDTINGTTRTITFVNPSYFGTVAATITAPTATDIKGLTKMKQTAKGYTNSSITMTYGKILYAYPKSYGTLTSIKDANNVQYINSYTRTEVTVDDVAMYCYLLTDAAGVSNFTQIYS